jgi:hypothetical protein
MFYHLLRLQLLSPDWGTADPGTTSTGRQIIGKHDHDTHKIVKVRVGLIAKVLL